MLRAGYSLLLWLALPLIAIRLWLRGRSEPGYRQRLSERFGRYEFKAAAPVIWLHAVSVGAGPGWERRIRRRGGSVMKPRILGSRLAPRNREGGSATARRVRILRYVTTILVRCR